MLKVELDHIVSESDAAQKILEILKDVETNGETYAIMSNGQPVAAIVSMDQVGNLGQINAEASVPAMPAVPAPAAEMPMPAMPELPPLPPMDAVPSMSEAPAMLRPCLSFPIPGRPLLRLPFPVPPCPPLPSPLLWAARA